MDNIHNMENVYIADKFSDKLHIYGIYREFIGNLSGVYRQYIFKWNIYSVYTQFILAI